MSAGKTREFSRDLASHQTVVITDIMRVEILRFVQAHIFPSS